MGAIIALAAALALQGGGMAAPTPVGDSTAWFSEADYPLDARNRGEQGRTTIRVMIDADGRPRDCLVTASSGSASLDATTCAIVIKAGRFAPARDAAGRAVGSTWSRSVNWALPARDPAQRTSMNQLVTLRIGADDALVGCETLVNGKPPATGPDDGCAMFRNAPAYMYHGLKGKYATGAAIVTIQNLLHFAGEPQVDEQHKRANADLLALRREAFSVLPDGSVTERRTVETGGRIGTPPPMPASMLGPMQPISGRTDQIMLLSTVSAAPAG